MPNQARVSISYRRTVGDAETQNDVYQNNPTAWDVDVTDGAGPSPGFLVIPEGGKVIDLSALSDPGPCIIQCVESDDDIYVEYGLYDPSADRFWPLGEVKGGGGPTNFITLSRNFREQYEGTGTGTTSQFMLLMMKAYGAGSAGARVKVEAFNN